MESAKRRRAGAVVAAGASAAGMEATGIAAGEAMAAPPAAGRPAEDAGAVEDAAGAACAGAWATTPGAAWDNPEAAGVVDGDAGGCTVAGWAGDGVGVGEGSVRSVMAERGPPTESGDGSNVPIMSGGGAFGVEDFCAGAPAGWSAGLIGDTESGENGAGLGPDGFAGGAP